MAAKPVQSKTYMEISGVDAGGERVQASCPGNTLLVAQWSLTLPSRQGCLSMVLDPDFSSNKFFYMYCSLNSVGSFQILRFTHQENGGGMNSFASTNSKFVVWTDPDGNNGTPHEPFVHLPVQCSRRAHPYRCPEPWLPSRPLPLRWRH
jgi:hypothetical protein